MHYPQPFLSRRGRKIKHSLSSLQRRSANINISNVIFFWWQSNEKYWGVRLTVPPTFIFPSTVLSSSCQKKTILHFCSTLFFFLFLFLFPYDLSLNALSSSGVTVLNSSCSLSSSLSDSCVLDGGLIIPWICQALATPMSSCSWCYSVGSWPATILISRDDGFSTCCSFNMCMSIHDFSQLPYAAFGGPQWRLLQYVMLVSWLGNRDRWLSRQRNAEWSAAPFHRPSNSSGPQWTVLPWCEMKIQLCPRGSHTGLSSRKYTS